jgi:dimethylhistidine N-methyltransferase
MPAISREHLLLLEIENPALRAFRTDVLRGLASSPRELPCKYFYDEAGSELFEQITELDEYYLTRTERGIMERHAGEMAERLGPRCLLIEYGSGSSTKTRLLLDALTVPAGYVPIDVSGAFLRRAAADLAREYPDLRIAPVCADFNGPINLPAVARHAARRVIYFPGSTIGNFTPAEAFALLRRTAELCGPGGAFLVGTDLQKDPRILEAAYNDRPGVTAAFNRNILVRINRELEGNFVIEHFHHRAWYNEPIGRIEMYLQSDRRQRVRAAGSEFPFLGGESIRTEYSYKYTLDGIREMAQAAGFRLEHSWTDERNYFSVSLLVAG